MPIPIVAGECGCLLNAQVSACDRVLGTDRKMFGRASFDPLRTRVLHAH